MAQPVIIDCDPGHDDAVALFLALADPAISVTCVTTVAGNQTLERVTQNARSLLTVAECSEIPVAAGASDPLVRDLETAGEVHGDSGLGGVTLPSPKAELEAYHAVTRIAHELETSKEPVTIIATGPLTNIALTLRLYPELTAAIKRIVVMGGALNSGNVTPVAEFNSYVDPEAASVVYEASVPVTMIGLNVTRQAQLSADTFERFREMNNRIGPLVAQLLSDYLTFHREQFGWNGVVIHDACAVASVIDDSLIETKEMGVRVETGSQLTRGQTVCDRWGVTDWDGTVSVGVDIARPAFHELLFDRLASY